LLIAISKLCLQVLQLDLELVVDSHDLIMLALVLLGERSHMRLELLDQVLLVSQLLLHHLKLLLVLSHARVVLRSYLQFDVLLLQLLDLPVKVVKFSLVFLYFFLIFGDPLLVLCRQFQLIFFKLLDLLFPLVITLALEQLNLSLKLLDHIVFLLELHVDHALGCEVTAIVTIDSRDQIN